MRTELSPAAQAVMDAISTTVDKPMSRVEAAAAALRAAAVYCKRDALALLCIADELEAQ